MRGSFWPFSAGCHFLVCWSNRLKTGGQVECKQVVKWSAISNTSSNSASRSPTVAYSGAVLVLSLVAADFDARQVEQTRRLQLVAAFLGDLLLQHPHAGAHPGSALSCPYILIFQQS